MEFRLVVIARGPSFGKQRGCLHPRVPL